MNQLEALKAKLAQAKELLVEEMGTHPLGRDHESLLNKLEIIEKLVDSHMSRTLNDQNSKQANSANQLVNKSTKSALFLLGKIISDLFL
jgi:hypothetical protein